MPTDLFSNPALIAAVAAYLALANALALVLFRQDKRRAEAGDWRLPEVQLLTVALMGGWLGAKAGQRLFHHKTVKQPFATVLNLSGLALPLVLGLALALTQLPADLPQRLAGLLPAAAAPAEAEAKPAERVLPRRFGPTSGGAMVGRRVQVNP